MSNCTNQDFYQWRDGQADQMFGSVFEERRIEGDAPKQLYESELEEAFARRTAHYWAHGVVLYVQVKVDSGYRNYPYRLDFLAVKGAHRIAFEIDGGKFHNWEKDLKRDKQIVKSGVCRYVCRIRGKDWFYRELEIVALLASDLQSFFNDRAKALSPLLRHYQKKSDLSGFHWYTKSDDGKSILLVRNPF